MGNYARFMKSAGIHYLILLGLCASAHAATPTEMEYFPPELGKTTVPCRFDNRTIQVPALPDFAGAWFSGELREAKEPSLYQQSLSPKNSASNTYRFTWLRSFHPRIVVRIDENSKGEMSLTAKQLRGQDGPVPNRAGKTAVRRLTSAESADVRRVFGANDLAQLKFTPCDGGSDGSQWLVERRMGSSYRFINRWSPESGPVHRVGILLLHLTGWNPDPIY